MERYPDERRPGTELSLRGELMDPGRPATVGVMTVAVQDDEVETIVMSTAADGYPGLRELVAGKEPEGFTETVKGDLPKLEDEQYVGAVPGPDGTLEGSELVPPRDLWEKPPKIEGVHATFSARVLGRVTNVAADTAAQFCLIKRSALSNSSYVNRRKTRIRLLGVGGDLKVSDMAMVCIRFGTDGRANQGIWTWALIVPEESIPFPGVDMVCDFTTLQVVAGRLDMPEAGNYAMNLRPDVDVKRLVEETGREEIKGAVSSRVCRPYAMGPAFSNSPKSTSRPHAAAGAGGGRSSE